MDKIAVILDVNQELQDKIKDAAGENEVVFYTDEKNAFVSHVSSDFFADADIIIGQPNPSELKKAEKLKWLQSRSSGVDIYEAEGVLKDGIILTSATGAYGVSVAEHVFAMMISIMKRLPAYRDNQHASLWRDQGEVKSPAGSNILVVGTGDLGATFARYCKAFGAHTIGVRRDKSVPAEGIDEMHGMDEIDTLLKTADVVAVFLPHSEDTIGFFNYDRFMAMKKDAIFLNAGRGPIVDNMDLYRALEEGQLFGAGLDTTAPEPLPEEHPLWTQPRATITPHSAGGDHLDDTLSKVVDIAVENLKRYYAGEPLINRKR